MSLNDLANLGQIIGALAVVISLIYVALSIRQNQRDTRRHRAICARTLYQLVQFVRRRRNTFRDRNQGIERLRIVVGNRESAFRRIVHGVPLLRPKRVFEMAAKTA